MNGLRGGMLAVTFAVLALVSVSSGAADPVLQSETGAVRIVEVARGLETPWSMAFLPDGRLLVTERPGRMRLVGTDGTVSAPLDGVPAVHARGQGGLLDVALSPQFKDDRTLVFSFAQPTAAGARTAVARARLDLEAMKLEDVRIHTVLLNLSL